MSSQVTVDTTARNAVQAFLAATEGCSPSSTSAEETALPAFRPSRLGLGATFVSHAAGAGSIVERRLAGALRKERQNVDADERERDEESSDEEDVSKAKSMGKRKRSRHDADIALASKKSKSKGEARKIQMQNQIGGQVLQNVIECKPVCTDGTDVGNMFKTNAGELGDERNAAVQKKAISSWMLRKKHKKRSRQKNLRRDKRAPHEKPSYLTAETLRGRRESRQVSFGNAKKIVG